MTAPESGVHRDLILPHPRKAVWNTLTDSALLAQWLHPNDFEPRVGHRFTFRVPPKPEVGFPGLTVDSEVLVLDPPAELVLAWNAAPPVSDTRVTFRLEPHGPDGAHTRLLFTHTGFDVDHPHGKQALGGASYGWKAMLDALKGLLVDTL